MFHIPVFFILLGVYFLPALVAHMRRLHESTAITMLNLFLGWTFFGWVAALIWAITAPAPYVVYVHPPYPPRYY